MYGSVEPCGPRPRAGGRWTAAAAAGAGLRRSAARRPAVRRLPARAAAALAAARLLDAADSRIYPGSATAADISSSSVVASALKACHLGFPLRRFLRAVGERGALVPEQIDRIRQVEQLALEPHVALLDFRVDREHRPLGAQRRGEDAHQRGVVLLGNRIELVIVAPRARDRNPEHAARHGIDALVPVVGHETADHLSRQPPVVVIDRRGADIPQRAHVSRASCRASDRRRVAA